MQISAIDYTSPYAINASIEAFATRVSTDQARIPASGVLDSSYFLTEAVQLIAEGDTYVLLDITSCNSTANLDELGTRNCSVEFALAFQPEADVSVTLSMVDSTRAVFVSSNGDTISHGKGAAYVVLNFTVESYNVSQFVTVSALDDYVWNGDVYTGEATPVYINITEVITSDPYYSTGLLGYSFNLSSLDNEAYGTQL
jgi:hypothetical protein